MPIYRYWCSVCQHEFEKIIKFDDSPTQPCEKCGCSAGKIPSAGMFVINGFSYKNGYSSEANKK